MLLSRAGPSPARRGAVAEFIRGLEGAQPFMAHDQDHYAGWYKWQALTSVIAEAPSWGLPFSLGLWAPGALYTPMTSR